MIYEWLDILKDILFEVLHLPRVLMCKHVYHYRGIRLCALTKWQCDHYRCPKYTKSDNIIKSNSPPFCGLANKKCYTQGNQVVWCLVCPFINEEDRQLVRDAINPNNMQNKI